MLFSVFPIGHGRDGMGVVYRRGPSPDSSHPSH